MEQLAEKAGQCSSKAFMALVEGMKVQMYRTAYMQLHNEQDALDAIQQTLEKAFLNIGNLKEFKYFKTWIIRILFNECHNIQRYKRKIIPMEREFQGDEVTAGLMDKLELKNLLQGLDSIYREVIDLRYNHDLKIDEIAGLLNIPSGTVKSRLNKAHKLLRTQYFEGEVSI